MPLTSIFDACHRPELGTSGGLSYRTLKNTLRQGVLKLMKALNIFQGPGVKTIGSCEILPARDH